MGRSGGLSRISLLNIPYHREYYYYYYYCVCGARRLLANKLVLCSFFFLREKTVDHTHTDTMMYALDFQIFFEEMEMVGCIYMQYRTGQGYVQTLLIVHNSRAGITSSSSTTNDPVSIRSVGV